MKPALIAAAVAFGSLGSASAYEWTSPVQSAQLRAVESTLTAMNDGGSEHDAGRQIVQYMRAKNIRVEFGKWSQPALTKRGGDGTTVLLSDTLPLYPRVLAPHIAGEVAKHMLDEMTISAEWEYMRVSLQARVWLELKGSQQDLPVIEHLTGYKDEALAAEMKLWLDNKPQAALEAVGRATQSRYLGDIIGQANNGGTVDQAMKTEKYFSDFLASEREWRLIHGPTLEYRRTPGTFKLGPRGR